MTQGPVLIDLEGEPAETPSSAPPVPELEEAPSGQAMQTLAALGARRPSRLGRFFWSSLVALIGFAASVAAWDLVTGLLARNAVIGTAALVLLAAVLLALAMIGLRELSAFARLRRIDTVQKAGAAALVSGDLGQARQVVARLERLYAARDELRWGRERLAERQGDMFDADGLLGLAEAELLAPLDAAARREVEGAARQVATVTALVPLALADLFAALSANLRMIRRIAEIYGGRSGTLGSWRITRAVLTHLVATGAVAVGDDMIEPLIGGGLVGKVSRRFGEGLVNGALTARVGVAAIEVCRPLPFVRAKRPSASRLVQRSLTGLFSKGAA
ncbi:TIGR01620 family protein [Actibacterium sp. MT2.3-13A]|uniref:YcjF family protein n=1 Tax=Actibacterium sp. MT2.3-13A TaxID=2828332 RepID=UPI001BA5DBD5|nr:TIGR01620 family protein [Actibacterium sp. MT2.3-13A]